ncbi:MAG TPA: electron transfer flavoprotein subunit alpha/FixB family protein [Terracidiphilus sp.]|nr:electron transfer flavoprotein subunit alpha/FixB family protein [Terracidiphilus sp.]
MSVLLVLEERGGRISRISWEAAAAAQQLASSQEITAVVIGAQTEALAAEAAAKQFGKIVRVEHALLAQYTSDGFCAALHQLIQNQSGTKCVVFPHTYQVRDYAPALATRMGEVLIGDVISIDAGPMFTRQLMQGRLNGSYRHSGAGPCVVSVQAGAFRAELSDAPASVPIETFTPTLDAAQIRTKPGEPFRGGALTVDLGSAQLIVSVGRGIREAENISLIQELASALGAELAASRPICDNGWLPMERQVGSSGQSVAPKLYLAVGISGAIQHLVGMKGSQCIVAINKDPDAPIFEIADYGIAGDLFEVVPALTEAIRAAKQ